MANRPNIVFIFSDQQRSDTLACYGNDWIKVPHLNKLADQSFVFENAYVTQPVCTPARASRGASLLLSGCMKNLLLRFSISAGRAELFCWSLMVSDPA